MPDEMTITTNHVPRNVIDAYELTAAERAEFDYLPWQAIDAGEDSASFFRYRGELYDLGEFVATDRTRELRPRSPLCAWDGYRSDSFFSATVVRYVYDEFGYPTDTVVVGLALS